MPLLPYPDLQPRCPIHLLPEPFLGAVRYAIHAKEVPAGIALTDAIAAAAAVVHCGFDCIALDRMRLPTTVNTLGVCPSGDGKGTSVKIFFKPFIQRTKELTTLARTSCGITKGRTRKHVPVVETTMSRVSYAALMRALDGRGMTVAIQREEGASFLKTSLFRDNIDVLAQLWSGDPPLDDHVFGKDISAADSRCSFGFRIQPDLMYSALKKGGLVNFKLGFWPRCIAACHDPERFPVDACEWLRPDQVSSAQAFQGRLVDLAAMINDHHKNGFGGRIGLSLDDEAKVFMRELQFRLKGWKTQFYLEIREAAARAWENTLRIATVMHVFCKRVGNVGIDLVECAWAIVEWSLSQHRLIFVEALRETSAMNAASGMPLVQPVRFIKLPKQPKMPRPLEDAKWFLACLQKLWRGFDTCSVEAVNLLAGLPPKRLETAIAWLKLEGVLTVDERDGVKFVRLPW